MRKNRSGLLEEQPQNLKQSYDHHDSPNESIISPPPLTEYIYITRLSTALLTAPDQQDPDSRYHPQPDARLVLPRRFHRVPSRLGFLNERGITPSDVCL